MQETEQNFAEQTAESTADVLTQDSVAETDANGQATKTTDNESNNSDNKAVKKKKPLPAGIQKIADYLKAHEDIRQMVFFLMFSVLCGLSQMIVTYGLSAGLKLADGLRDNFAWFIFKYDTTAEFIGFLIGSIVGQVLTFILNRKKTFNTPDHVVIRAVMYTILAILIILMQTALGGAVTSACYNAVPENEASEFLKFVFNLTGLAVGGIAAVIVNFLGNKFLVMRDWGKKKNKAEADKANANTADVEQSAAVSDNADNETNSPSDVTANNTSDVTLDTAADIAAEAASDETK